LAAVYGVIRYGPAWLRDSRERQQAQAAAAREQEALAREQAEQIRLDRYRLLHSWSAHGIDAFGVALVTSGDEMTRAQDELLASGPCDYVIPRGSRESREVREHQPGSLAQADHQGGLRLPAPEAGEREALEEGLAKLGILRDV
jgi:hypothetical protein